MTARRRGEIMGRSRKMTKAEILRGFESAMVEARRLGHDPHPWATKDGRIGGNGVEAVSRCQTCRAWMASDGIVHRAGGMWKACAPLFELVG
jgi:hypothetical protein